jgi:hypothetical protein
MNQAAEQVYFEGEGVRVTRQRFQVGAQTHAMANVSSVKFHRHDPPSGFPMFLFVVAGVTLLPAAFALWVKAWAVGAFFGAFVIGCSAWAVWLLRRPPQYSVTLVTGAGEMQALLSADHARIKTIVDALNEAIVSRG